MISIINQEELIKKIQIQITKFKSNQIINHKSKIVK